MIRFVYVAGPITLGDPMVNTRNAIFAADRVWAAGITPFVPHLSCFWQAVSPHEYEDWMAMDFNWISRCDAVLRLPGESKGADREVAFAREAGIPVFFSVEDLLLAHKEGLVTT